VLVTDDGADGVQRQDASEYGRVLVGGTGDQRGQDQQREQGCDPERGRADSGGAPLEAGHEVSKRKG
jgi:hypothetical protein